LTAVALQLQPGWADFLNDCRVRLPAQHPLNDMGLATSAQLAIDGEGRASVAVADSGNRDFDRAVQDAIADAQPLPKPPAELVSDDDRVHLQWLFARDSRQAGPATAHVIDVELPLDQVIPRWLGKGELARAARRVARAPAGGERDRAARAVMEAALQEALKSSDPVVAQEAAAASARLHASATSPPPPATCKDVIRGLDDHNATVRAACIDAVVGKHDARLAARVRELARDRDVNVRARAVAALVELDPAHPVRATSDASREVRTAYAAALRHHLDRAELAADAASLADDRDPQVRAGAWAALADAPDRIADAHSIDRALADPAAGVRMMAAQIASDPAALARLAVSDDDPNVRTEALVRLAQVRGRAAVETDLLARVAAAPPASSERVRAALAWLLAR
jgi:hypothetical protein